MWDEDSSIQYRPRHIVSSKEGGGVAIKRKHTPKIPCRQVSTGERHIAFNLVKKTYKVHLNRRTMIFCKDGFETIEEAIAFRNQKLSIAPEREFRGSKKKLIECPIGV